MEASVRGMSCELPHTLRERSPRIEATELTTRSERWPRKRMCCKLFEIRAMASRYTCSASWNPNISVLERKPTSTETLCRVRDRHKLRGNFCLVAPLRTRDTMRSAGRTRLPEAIAATTLGRVLRQGNEQVFWPTFRTREA